MTLDDLAKYANDTKHLAVSATAEILVRKMRKTIQLSFREHQVRLVVGRLSAGSMMARLERKQKHEDYDYSDVKIIGMYVLPLPLRNLNLTPVKRRTGRRITLVLRGNVTSSVQLSWRNGASLCIILEMYCL